MFPVNVRLKTFESEVTAPMNAQMTLLFVLFCAVAYGLAFAAGTVLVEILGGPWRRSVGSHWTERARLGFASGFAVLWLLALLPPLAGMVGEGGLWALAPELEKPMFGFAAVWAAAFAGTMTARYRWLRELWGVRVTLRSWLAGCLVLVLAIFPHLIVMAGLVVLMPKTMDARGVLIFGGGVLAVAFFARGGGVPLLRLLGVVRPAPPALTKMVEQLAQDMKVPGQIKVLQLHWAQVNAVAWTLYRAVGFSRPLLEVMSEDEVRAVAAHELAHLIEPRWVRAVRVAQMFAYLPVALLLKCGGDAGIPMGYLLLLAIMLGYRRFTRVMEQRADGLERETITDPGAYMRSMIKLGEANLTPAVMPGGQTHQHLYDRLLAGGIQPDFPRPTAPLRAKPLLAAMAAAILTMVVIFAMVVSAGVAVRLAQR